jgi:hypothetical protein
VLVSNRLWFEKSTCVWLVKFSSNEKWNSPVIRKWQYRIKVLYIVIPTC